MPTLEELLRATLNRANEKFDQANKALHTAVVEAAKAVEAVTNGKAALRLVKIGEDDSSARYALRAQAGAQTRDLANFNVTKEGYPILRVGFHTGEIAEKFESLESLSSYFKQLLSDQNSPLIAYLAYIVRNTPETAPAE